MDPKGFFLSVKENPYQRWIAIKKKDHFVTLRTMQREKERTRLKNTSKKTFV